MSNSNEAWLGLEDQLFTSFRASAGGNFRSTLRHWEKYKGLPFVVNYLKDLKVILLHKELPTGKGPNRIIRDFLISGKHSRRPTTSLQRKIAIFRLSKSAALFRATIKIEDYHREIVRLLKPHEFDEVLAESLLHGIRSVAPIPWRPVVFNTMKKAVQIAMTQEMGYKQLYKVPSLVIDHEQVIGFYYQIRSVLDFYPHRMFVRDNVGQAILLNKDGALKKRLIFSPIFPVQLCMERLYQALEAYAKRLKSLYVWDVEAGIRWVAQQPEADSIDLESATDYFPLHWQEKTLRALFPHLEGDIAFFVAVAKSEWSTPAGPLRILVGQPMGLKPSFLSFSVVFYHLLRGITHEDNFALLGDDLITTDPDVLPCLLRLGLKVSLRKTFRGSYKEWGGTTVLDDIDLGLRRIKPTSDYLTMIWTRGPHAALSAIRRDKRAYIWESLKWIANLPPPVGLGLKPSVIDTIPPAVLYDLYTPTDEIVLSGSRAPDLAGWSRKLNVIDAFNGIHLVERALRAGINDVKSLEIAPGVTIEDLELKVRNTATLQPYVESSTFVPPMFRGLKVERSMVSTVLQVMGNLLGLTPFKVVIQAEQCDYVRRPAKLGWQQTRAKIKALWDAHKKNKES